MQEQSNTEIFGREGWPVFSLTLLELVVFLYTTTLDLVEQLVWGTNRLWVQTSSCVCLWQSGVKSCWFTYLIRKPPSSCELPLHGDLRVGFTPPSADVSKGVTLASGDTVIAVGFRAQPKGGIWNSWLTSYKCLFPSLDLKSVNRQV